MKQSGIVLFSDLIFRPEKLPLNFTFRICFFDTDSYDSRIYAYEHDVLYAFSVPAYFHRGNRFYIMSRIKLSGFIDLWIRYSLTVYHNRNRIGSGLDEIEGNSKSDVKIQLRIKI